ncbi:MAG: GNAT family N-acetyltransferase [Chromatocurvus sp.]
MSVSVREARPDDEASWEAFVNACPHTTFFHRFAWQRVLRRAFGYTPHFLLAESDAGIEGVLPLATVRSVLTGNRLCSLPFCVYGGIAANTDEAAHVLRDKAKALAESEQVDALELRCREPSGSDWPVKELYYTFRKPLEADNAANLKAVPNRQRAMLRKALGEGLYSEEDHDGVDRLYRVYAESVRNLGTPVFSRRYLQILREEFAGDCRVLMIRQAADGAPKGKPDDAMLLDPPDRSGEAGEDVAAVMSFYFKGDVLPYYGGGITRARDIRGCNHFLYWELMRSSANERLTGFDFGRSKADTGPFAFKKNMGFSPEPLPYEYHLVAADAPPDLNPNSPRYRLLVNTWQKLPLWLANRLGPPLARHLG